MVEEERLRVGDGEKKEKGTRVGRQSGARRRRRSIRVDEDVSFLFLARHGKRPSRRRPLSRFVRGAERPPRIAPNRDSRFFAETVRGRDARGAGSARDRASRDVGG